MLLTTLFTPLMSVTSLLTKSFAAPLLTLPPIETIPSVVVTLMFSTLVCRTPKGDFEVSVEETDEGDRYDVLVKGGKFPIVLEGKTGLRQSHRQLLRYVQTVRPKYKRRPGLVIVDVGSHKSQGFPHVAALVYFAVGFGWRGYSHCARVGGTQNDHHDDAIFTPCPATQAASRGHIGR